MQLLIHCFFILLIFLEPFDLIIDCYSISAPLSYVLPLLSFGLSVRDR